MAVIISSVKSLRFKPVILLYNLYYPTVFQTYTVILLKII